MPETSLLELDLEGLIGVMEELGQPAYRARQVYRQIWQRGALDPTEMSDLPRELRAELAARTADAPTPLATQTSADGSTTKALVPLADGEMVETVLIRHDPHAQGNRSSPTQRRTVCLSTQAGCAMGCTFCATGAQGFRRQLTVGEVLVQALLARRWVREDGDELTHVVFMGMGRTAGELRWVSSAAFDAALGGGRVRALAAAADRLRRLGCRRRFGGWRWTIHRSTWRSACTRRTRSCGAKLVPVPTATPLEIVGGGARAQQPHGAARDVRIRAAGGGQRLASAAPGAGRADRGDSLSGEPDPVQPVARRGRPAAHPRGDAGLPGGADRSRDRDERAGREGPRQSQPRVGSCEAIDWRVDCLTDRQ